MSEPKVAGVSFDLLVDEVKVSIEVGELLGIPVEDRAEIIVAKFAALVERVSPTLPKQGGSGK